MTPCNQSDFEAFSDEELSYWIAFNEMKGVRLKPEHLQNVLDLFENLGGIWNASKQELLDSRLFNREYVDNFFKEKKEHDPEKLLAVVKEKDVSVLAFTHPLYPLRLRHIHDPPMVLYVLGGLEPEDFGAYTLAVVGTRRPTAYGRKMSKKFASELSAVGATIVSGMAFGVDSLAHWGALDTGGKTIAVLASGVDICYPSSNKPLYAKLTESENACVVSEYLPGTNPEKWRFPRRNRIISGLSEGVLVIEAGQESGSLITCNQAFNQSRTVMALPGKADSEMSLGCNDLIYKQIASLVMNSKQVMECMNWVPSVNEQKVPAVVELFGREKEVYDMLSSEPAHFDFLCHETGMAAGEMSGTLTILELAGVVERHPGEWFTKNEP